MKFYLQGKLLSVKLEPNRNYEAATSSNQTAVPSNQTNDPSNQTAAHSNQTAAHSNQTPAPTVEVELQRPSSSNQPLASGGQCHILIFQFYSNCIILFQCMHMIHKMIKKKFNFLKTLSSRILSQYILMIYRVEKNF